MSSFPYRHQRLITASRMSVRVFEDGNKNNVSIAADTGEIMTVTPGAGDTAYALRHTVTEIGGELKIPLNSAGFAPGQNLRAGA